MSEGVTVVTGAVEGFDYGALDSETRIVVQQRTGEIRSLVRRSAQDVCDLGAKLIEVKDRLGDGNFREWLRSEFGWSHMTAYRFIQVHERFGRNNLLQVDVAPSALYLLAAPSTPEEAVDEALERAAGGERITHAAARDIVGTYRPPVGRVDGVDGVDGRRAGLAGRGETEEELRQRIRETDRRWKDEINGRYAAPAGPALPPVELMPIEDWELAEFVERVAGEVFGERLGSAGALNAMAVSVESRSGEFWTRLKRALAPFDVVDDQVMGAVAEFLVKADGKNGQRSTGGSSAPSAEARRFGQEVKAATWGGVQRDDRPMVTAEGLANSLRGWAAQVEPARLRAAAEYRGGAVWFEARQVVSGLNYRDKELVAALGMLSEERGARGEEEEENGQLSTVNGQWSMGDGEPAPVLFVDDDELRKLAKASYSGDTLTGYGKPPYLRGMFEYDGRRWVAVVGNGTSVRVHELDEEIAPGETVRGIVKDAYKGREATYRGKKYRLGAQWLVVTRSDNPLLSDDEGEESREDEENGQWSTVNGQLSTDGADAVPVSQRDGYDSDEWYTPRWVIEAARSVMGEIDLDPASCALAQDVVQAGLFWSKTQGGERMGWFGRVWLNPPYSAPALFVEKLMSEYRDGSVKQAVVLLNNATETGWFQALLARFPVCFLSKRLAFWRHDHADVGARQGQAVFYLGPDVERFCEVFGEFGIVVRRVD